MAQIPAEEMFDRYAGLYETRFMDLSRYSTSLAQFCMDLPAGNVEVLDVACGPGNVSKHLLHLRPELRVLGIDLAPKMLELARINNPQAEFRVMDMRQIHLLTQRFGGVICGFGLPYLSAEEALKFIDDAARLLVPGGLLYLSTMEADPQKSGIRMPSTGGEDGVYTTYHLSETLVAAFSNLGLQLVLEARLPDASPNAESVDLILMGRKVPGGIQAHF
jgi:ubiquinone/menaquinone biosynthesis C-methylase UbiE